MQFVEKQVKDTEAEIQKLIDTFLRSVFRIKAEIVLKLVCCLNGLMERYSLSPLYRRYQFTQLASFDFF